MTKQEFVSQLAEELELEIEVNLNTEFKELDEWDSMGAMILIGFVSDNFSKSLNSEDIKELSTFQSLIEKIGLENFEN